MLDKDVLLRVGLFDGVPNDPNHPRHTSLKLSPGEGGLLVFELGYRGLTVGGWAYTARQDTLDGSGQARGSGGTSGAACRCCGRPSPRDQSRARRHPRALQSRCATAYRRTIGIRRRMHFHSRSGNQRLAPIRPHSTQCSASDVSRAIVAGAIVLAGCDAQHPPMRPSPRRISPRATGSSGSRPIPTTPVMCWSS